MGWMTAILSPQDACILADPWDWVDGSTPGIRGQLPRWAGVHLEEEADFGNRLGTAGGIIDGTKGESQRALATDTIERSERGVFNFCQSDRPV